MASIGTVCVRRRKVPGFGLSLCLLCVLCAVPLANAVASSIWFDTSHDTTGIDSKGLDLNVGLSNGAALLLSTRATRSNTPPSGSDTRYWSVGFDTDRRAPVHVSLQYAYWGHTGELETQALKLAVAYVSGDWSLRLLPEYRRIHLYAAPRFLRRQATLGSTGLGGELAYSGYGKWFWNVGAHIYNYSRDPSILGAQRAARVFSSATLALTQGFLKRSVRLELGYSFNPADVSLVWSRYISAIDGSTSNTYAATTTLYRFDPVRFSLEGGVTQDEATGSAMRYLALSAGYVW